MPSVKGNTRRLGGVRLEPRYRVMVVQGTRGDGTVPEKVRLQALARLSDDERPKPRLPRVSAFVAPMFG